MQHATPAHPILCGYPNDIMWTADSRVASPDVRVLRNIRFVTEFATVPDSSCSDWYYEDWNFNSDNYLFTTDTK